MARCFCTVAGISILAFSVSSLPARDDVNVYTITQEMSDVFRANAAAYVCTVVHCDPSATPAFGTSSGLVHLAVTRTLRGANKTELVLPYAFAVDPSICLHGGMFIWPRLDRIGDTSLLCVVLPKEVATSSAGDGVACLVAMLGEQAEEKSSIGDRQEMVRPQLLGYSAQTIKDASPGNRDPVASFAAMTALYDQAEPDLLEKDLSTMVADPRPAVRAFARKAAVIRLGRIAPEKAIEFVESRMCHAHPTGDPVDAEVLVRYLADEFPLAWPSPVLRCVMFRCLVHFINADAPSAHSAALFAVVDLIEHRGNIIPLAEHLSDQERDILWRVVYSTVSTAATPAEQSALTRYLTR